MFQFSIRLDLNACWNQTFLLTDVTQPAAKAMQKAQVRSSTIIHQANPKSAIV
jgi:hypothetical protein